MLRGKAARRHKRSYRLLRRCNSGSRIPGPTSVQFRLPQPIDFIMIICDKCYELEKIKYIMAGMNHYFDHVEFNGINFCETSAPSNYKCRLCNKKSKKVKYYAISTLKQYLALKQMNRTR